MTRTIRIALAGLMMAAVARQADARVTKIEIRTRETPTFGGYSFPGIGPYEKIVGKAFAELDPNDPANKVIVDLKLAPRNRYGKVEYSFDFYILKPIDLSRGAHKVMYEAPNRGNKTHRGLNRGAGGNDPGSVVDPAELGNTFLLPRGYTLVWSGWDYSAAADSTYAATITLPVAKNADGSSITGPAYEYIVNGGTSFSLSYAAATTDRGKATLTHRVHLDDQPEIVAATSWTFNAAGTAISLLPEGTRFTPNDIYEFSYIAKDPTVNGVGFAAVRDFNAFLRYATADAAGTRNPLAGDITRIYTEAVSQPARMLNDFRTLGFNRSEDGKIVFDGMLQWIAAGDGINMNYRFSQPGRTERNRQDQLYVEGVFPFANQRRADPISGRTAGRYDACSRSNTCPLAIEIYSSNEYWSKGASLLHTDPAGTIDLPEHDKTRLYLVSSHQHGVGNANTKGSCQQFGNPLDSSPVLRALWDALDQWSTAGTAPPPSMVPRFAEGTLVAALPQHVAGFPRIPGVAYTGLKSTRYRLDYGADFYSTGIMTVNPPVVTAPLFDNPKNGPIYPTFVPKTDADGNEIAGIRLADVSVPLATYTGWSLRAGAHANDGCEGAGQMIPFPKTKADRLASGDPRPSLEERYPSLSAYAEKISSAIEDLVGRRLMLREDAQSTFDRLLKAGQAAGLVNADPVNSLTAEERSQGWQLLFNGKSLEGWHVSASPQAAARAGQPQPPAPGQVGTPAPCVAPRAAGAPAVPGGSHWEIIDGLLTACGEPTGYLTSDRSFRNFVLSLEFKCGADTNSGVFVRSPQENGGYEVQIWRRQPAGFNTGAIVGTAKTAREYAFKADQWNRYRIIADGDHLVVELNGETTLDIHDAKFPEGHVRLQYQQFPIAFRNIKIRPLP